MRSWPVVVVMVQTATIFVAAAASEDIFTNLGGDVCEKKVCIPRCCKEGELMEMVGSGSGSKLECVSSTSATADGWLPNIKDEQGDTVTLAEDSVHFLRGFPSCGNMSRMEHYSSLSPDKPQVFRDGRLYLPKLGLRFSQVQYCVEKSAGSGGNFWVQVCLDPQDYLEDDQMEPKVTIPKCCPEGQDFNNHKLDCVTALKNASRWMPDTVEVGPTRIHKRLPASYELAIGMPKCPNTHKILKVIVDTGIPYEKRNWFLTYGGHLVLAQDPNVTFSWSNFCVDRLFVESVVSVMYYVVHVCVPDPYTVCKNTTCVSKCCPEGQSFSEDNPICVDEKQPWKPQFYSEGWWHVKPAMVDVSKFKFMYGVVNCVSDAFVLDPTNGDPNDAFYLLSNGKLLVVRFRQSYEVQNYCIDQSAEGPHDVAIVCFPKKVPVDKSGEEGITYTIYSIALLISSLFLLATFLVYALLPELQNLHGKTLLSHVGSLFFAYVFLSISQIGGDQLPVKAPTFCKIDAVLVHFFFVASFFWLNAMCFDIWWTFSGLRPLRGGAGERDRKKFLIYSVYSWGCAFILSGVAIVMDFVPGISPFLLKPVFGLRRCWFIGEWEQLAYFYGPIAFLIVTNMILFSLTAWKLLVVHRETKMLNDKKGNNRTSGKGSKRDKDKQRLVLYLKLFVIMGMTWVMEVVSWAVGGHTYYWYLSDVPNVLQGVFIFIIFVCKRKILRLLKGRVLSSRLSWRPSQSSSSRVGSTQLGSPSTTRSTMVTTVDHLKSKKVNLEEENNIQMSTVNGKRDYSF